MCIVTMVTVTAVGHTQPVQSQAVLQTYSQCSRVNGLPLAQSLSEDGSCNLDSLLRECLACRGQAR